MRVFALPFGVESAPVSIRISSLGGAIVLDANGSVTDLMLRIREGEEGDVQVDLFNRFYLRLVRLAEKQLSGRVESGENEDVALDALNSYFLRAANGDFCETHDRSSLWSLLARITLCKARDLQRKNLAQKRDRRRMVNTIDELIRNDPPEWFVSSFLNQGSEMLESIPKDGMLRRVAAMRLEGYSRTEIADELHLSLASVKRKLSRIREHIDRILSLEASR